MIKEGAPERKDAMFVLERMIGLVLPCRNARLLMHVNVLR